MAIYRKFMRALKLNSANILFLQDIGLPINLVLPSSYLVKTVTGNISVYPDSLEICLYEGENLVSYHDRQAIKYILAHIPASEKIIRGKIKEIGDIYDNIPSSIINLFKKLQKIKMNSNMHHKFSQLLLDKNLRQSECDLLNTFVYYNDLSEIAFNINFQNRLFLVRDKYYSAKPFNILQTAYDIHKKDLIYILESFILLNS